MLSTCFRNSLYKEQNEEFNWHDHSFSMTMPVQSATAYFIFTLLGRLSKLKDDSKKYEVHWKKYEVHKNLCVHYMILANQDNDVSMLQFL